MKFRVLPTPPISGLFREVDFGVLGAEGIWVLFDSEDGREWAGVFPGGMTGHSSVHLLPGTVRAFVVAAGKGYSIDTTSAAIAFESDTDCLCGAVELPVAHHVLAWDESELFVYSLEGLVWRSGRVALDGLEIRSVGEGKVEGALWDFDGWHEFTLTLDDFDFVRGQYLGGSWPTPPTPQGV